VFERHSGTGRDPTENKKGGAGKSNWGAAGKDDLAAVIDAATEPAAADDKEAADAVPADAVAAEGAAEGADAKGKEREQAAPVEEDPDDKLVTFDEYQKQQQKEAAEARKKFKQPKVRTAGEGVKLDPKWANAVPLKREEETSGLPVPVKAKKDRETKDGQPQLQQTKKSAPKEKTISAADIFRFDTSRPREGREGGSREGGRGGRGGFNREGGRGGFGGRGGRRDGAPAEGGARRPRREGDSQSPAQAPRTDAPKKETKAAPAPAISDAVQFPALGQ